ncbi:MAG: siderophore-interacting protein [Rheinheimera sp.]|nr:siderophore-interacting protein [Rheinheimera sp.]
MVQFNHSAAINLPRFRRVQLLQRRQVSVNLWRLTFGGPALAEMPYYWPACHIKLLLPKPGQRQPELPVFTATGPEWPDGAVKPEIRTFSVRAHRPALAELDIDVAVHGDRGPASRFAMHAQPGAHCALSLPAGPNPMLPARLPFLLAGDMTALPAICAMLEHLPTDAQGQVFALVSSAADMPQLAVPAGVACHWLIGDCRQTALLIDAVISHCQTRLPPADSYVFLAGEEQIVLQLRRFLRKQLPLSRQQLYALPYWRAGVDETGFAVLRAQQAATADAAD